MTVHPFVIHPSFVHFYKEINCSYVVIAVLVLEIKRSMGIHILLQEVAFGNSELKLSHSTRYSKPAVIRDHFIISRI